MPQTPPDFEKLIRAFSDEEVPFVVVGGIAMVLHGSDYSTVDADFAVATSEEATVAMVRALAPFNPRPSHYPPFGDFRWDTRRIGGAVVSLTTDVGDVDLLRFIPGVDSFEGIQMRSVARHVFGVDVQIASIQDLIAMKREANRPKDRNHILELIALERIHSQET